MHGRDEDDERQERERQEREREQMTLMDRLHGGVPLKTLSGDDDLRSGRRTGRVLQLIFRVHPRVRAIVGAIIERDGPMSLVMLFDLMLEAYQDKHGPVDKSKIPSDAELVRRYERERAKRDAK